MIPLILRRAIKLPQKIAQVAKRYANADVDNLCRVNKSEKKLLVSTGWYKSTRHVPNYVGRNVLRRSRYSIRIHFMKVLMLTWMMAYLYGMLFSTQPADPPPLETPSVELNLDDVQDDEQDVEKIVSQAIV